MDNSYNRIKFVISAPCSAGNYMTGNGCQQCGENTYSGAGASSCTSCPDDMISAAGSTSEADCEYGNKLGKSPSLFDWIIIYT